MFRRVWRVCTTLTCALALALSLNWGLARVHSQPLGSLIFVTSAEDGVADPNNCPSFTNCRLRDALAAASPFDVIVFNLPDDSVIVLTEGELVVDTPLGINGATSSNVAVSGNNLSRVFAVGVPLTIVSLTIEYGKTDSVGGGLATNSPVTLHQVAFLTNTAASHGGGLYAEGTVALSGTTFLSNTSLTGNGGGAYLLNGATVNGGAFERNTVLPPQHFADFGQGGGLWVSGTLNLAGTQFLSNTADIDGGGLHALSAATLADATFIANTTLFGFGGGMRAVGPADLSHVQFIRNLAVGEGGGMITYPPPVLTDTHFLSNTGRQFGGAIFPLGATLNGASFQGNTCTQSGCTNGGTFSYSAPGTLTLTQNVTTSDDMGIWGDWLNTGTFVQTAGTTTFYSYFPQSITGNGSTTFQHMHVSAAFGSGQGVTLYSDVNVRGDFTDTARLIPAGGAVHFIGTGAQHIAGTTPTTFGDLAIANTGAGVSLGQDITVTNRLTLTSDLSTTMGYTLLLTSNTVSMGTADVWGRTVRQHLFGLGTSYAFGNPFVTLNFTSGTSPARVTVDLAPALPANVVNSVMRVYAIEAVGGSNYAARLRLHYRDSELNGNIEGALQLWRYPPGGPWTAHTASGFDSTDNWVEHNGVSAFSLWTFAQSLPRSQPLYLPYIAR